MSRTVLITGATGFLGSHVCAALRQANGCHLRVLTRSTADVPGAEVIRYRDIEDAATLRRAVSDVDAVVHLAARVHVMRENTADALAAYRAVNTQWTERLGEEAGRAGVRLFLFASSVKAVGEQTSVPWNEDVRPSPRDPYGVSKLEAENVLLRIASESSMRAIILRLPVVYGAGVGANILQLFRMVDRGLPLPLAGINNRRSLVYAGNVASVIERLLRGNASTQTFFVSDGEDLSTPELVRRIAAALGRPARLLPAPTTALRMAGRVGDSLAGFLPFPITTAGVNRLIGSLVVDTARLRQALGGAVPYSVESGLQQTARWYRQRA
jgi:nucleoside-diphosphate-sugar epimerase